MDIRGSNQLILPVAFAAFLNADVVYAYVGPGAGITAIGSILALVLGVILAILGFVWYPIKRFMRSRASKRHIDKLAEEERRELPRDNKNP